ncbi:hypothetical protein BAUCODRAFT_141096 [Baudoinia panamericana UAMH 10762]|uniref:Uncharacterized protein n=1 Tax=Baudoinia panamericana (strain UAMH 10762) TaxID=717646 RepID=M2MTH0_BAUPA|nr:uncharacterized protein BAUCODRAFT_141096 [Baudoinia panamericana UAMH 10762]EMC94833.1 hypothetical protein BAUCODRAFT_141096 [Baudoinia panamericana UAMH 10762]
MEASPFARLSPELRNLIYEYAFASKYAVTLEHNRIQPGISRTCRRIREESLTMYYASTTFNAHLDDGPTTPVSRWLTHIGHWHSLLLQRLQIWDMHMLNATLHGLEATQLLLRNGDEEGTPLTLVPTGSWLLHQGWYLKDIIIALRKMDLELRRFARVLPPSAQSWPTSLFAITPSPRPRKDDVEGCYVVLRDVLAHLGFSIDMIEDVTEPLRHAGWPVANPPVGGEWKIEVSRKPRKYYLTFKHSELHTIRQSFKPPEDAMDVAGL